MKTHKSDAFSYIHPNTCGAWTEGSPLGNGDLGALMIPQHRQILFALAKSDVWDERYDDGSGGRRSFRVAETFDVLRDLIKEEKWDEIEERFDAAQKKWKGKFRLLPAGTLVLSTARFEKEIEVLEFGYALNLKNGLGSSEYSTRVRHQHTEAVVSDKHQVLAIQVKQEADWNKGSPIRRMNVGMDISFLITSSDPEVKIESGVSDGILWQRIRGYHKVDYTVAILVVGDGIKINAGQVIVTAEEKADFAIYVAIVSNKDVPNSKEEALQRVKAAAKVGFNRIESDNQRWWANFWEASSVEIPDTDLLRQYHFGLYLLGASSRKGRPMPGLQGLWCTSAEGSGWNDYTNDLDIEMNYWPIYASNHLELGWPYYDTVNRWLPETRKFTREYYGCQGIQFSCCASPEGIMPRGYVTTLHWIGMAAFVAQNFWSHYRYGRDREFLRGTAFPMLKECALFYLDFLKKDERGLYRIWPSNTPECGEGGFEAWGKNPAMDIALIRLLFSAVIESCHILGDATDLGAACQERLDHMPPYPIRNGYLIDLESKEFKYSHRLPGMLTPIYPCSDIEGAVAKRSIDRCLDKGRWQWCGFSPVWVAGASARVGRGRQAYDLLREFIEVYVTQSGFHTHFDHKGTGRGHPGGKCFTNESNSGFSAALLEMLLQSDKGTIEVFPAVPGAWKDLSFRDLRAEGAFLVSATRKKGKTTKITIRSEQGGEVRVRIPWRNNFVALKMNKGESKVLRSD